LTTNLTNHTNAKLPSGWGELEPFVRFMRFVV